MARILIAAAFRAVAVAGLGASIGMACSQESAPKDTTPDRGELERNIRSLPPGVERQRALAALARGMIQQDGPDALVGWAEALPDEPARLKLAAFRQVASELARANPAIAVAWCNAHCTGPFGSNLRTLVAMRWAAWEGQPALEWVATAPADAERDRAVRDAYRAWLRQNRQAAQRWLEEMDSQDIEPWLNPALGLYAMSIAEEFPREALRWAARIAEEPRRQAAQVAIARRWRSHDPGAADLWLEQSPLSEAARQQARRSTASPPGANPDS